jgi:hypothetical protein
VGIFTELVQARMQGQDEPRPDAGKAWRGSSFVVRRLTATWMSVLLWISLGMAAVDLVLSVDAFANVAYSRSIFVEEDVLERVAIVVGEAQCLATVARGLLRARVMKNAGSRLDARARREWQLTDR